MLQNFGDTRRVINARTDGCVEHCFIIKEASIEVAP